MADSAVTGKRVAIVSGGFALLGFVGLCLTALAPGKGAADGQVDATAQAEQKMCDYSRISEVRTCHDHKIAKRSHFSEKECEQFCNEKVYCQYFSVLHTGECRFFGTCKKISEDPIKAETWHKERAPVPCPVEPSAHGARGAESEEQALIPTGKALIMCLSAWMVIGMIYVFTFDPDLEGIFPLARDAKEVVQRKYLPSVDEAEDYEAHYAAKLKRVAVARINNVIISFPRYLPSVDEAEDYEAHYAAKLKRVAVAMGAIALWTGLGLSLVAASTANDADGWTWVKTVRMLCLCMIVWSVMGLIYSYIILGDAETDGYVDIGNAVQERAGVDNDEEKRRGRGIFRCLPCVASEEEGVTIPHDLDDLHKALC